jgi:hypothetical protein
LCVDEALGDLQTGLVFAQAAPEARGYHAKFWRRYVSTVRAWLWGVQLPAADRVLLDNNLNSRFFVESDVDRSAKRAPAVDGSHLIAERDLGRNRDGV